MLWEKPSPIACTNVEQSKHFDQIAYIAPILKDRLEDCYAGVFNYFKYVYREEPAKVYAPEFQAKMKMTSTYQMSDHLPMWIELHVDFNYSRQDAKEPRGSKIATCRQPSRQRSNFTL